MINRNTLLKYLAAASLSAVVAEPMLAHAAVCAGPRVPWTSKSTTFGNINCQKLASRGESQGQNNSQGGIAVPFRLNVTLIDGNSAQGLPYNSLGNPLAGCSPYDDSTADGRKSVEGLACVSGAQHQVLVAF